MPIPPAEAGQPFGYMPKWKDWKPVIKFKSSGSTLHNTVNQIQRKSNKKIRYTFSKEPRGKIGSKYKFIELDRKQKSISIKYSITF